MAIDNNENVHGIHVPQPTPVASPSPYSAYFLAHPGAVATHSTIRLPGDSPLRPRERVVRPALAVLFRIAIGPAADRYVRRFLAFERAGHTGPSWNWPSFLLPGVWAFYRKLWTIGLLFAMLPILGAFGFAALEPSFEQADLVWIACAIVAVWILPGVGPALFADSLLYNHCRYLIAQAERGAQGATDAVHWLSKRRPTSTAAALLAGGGAIVAMLAVVVPPLYAAYVELNVRSQLSQALASLQELEDDIEATWQSARLLPRQTDNPALRSHAAAVLIEDVHVNPRTGRVRLALGPAIPELAGKTILLAPARGETNHWHWMCVPVDIPARFLPKECRV